MKWTDWGWLEHHGAELLGWQTVVDADLGDSLCLQCGAYIPSASCPTAIGYLCIALSLAIVVTMFRELKDLFSTRDGSGIVLMSIALSCFLNCSNIAVPSAAWVRSSGIPFLNLSVLQGNTPVQELGKCRLGTNGSCCCGFITRVEPLLILKLKVSSSHLAFPQVTFQALTVCGQFFIPAGVRLVLEVFDFDVFESLHNAQSAPGMINGERSVSRPSEKGGTVQTRESNNLYHHAKESVQGERKKVLFNETNASNSKRFEGDYSAQSRKAKDKHVVAQEESAMLEMVKMPPLKQDFSITDSWLGDLNKNDSEESNLSYPLTGFVNYQDMNVDPQSDSKRVQQGGTRLEIDQREIQVNSLTEVTVIPVTKVTPLVPPEICPNDVLYISDLITFSARFCGANSPVNKTLTFGSSLEMVEVVVELITTTNKGRGFILLYQFKTGAEPDLQAVIKHRDQDNMIHFLVIAGIAILSTVLLIALCHTWRKKAHCKGSHSHCSRSRENGIQNSAVDIGEMQLVSNRSNQEVSLENENNNHSIGLGGMGNSNRTEMEVASSESAVTETGSDEIFVISTGLSLRNLHFSSFKTKVPKRSPTSPSLACDWLAPDLLVSEGEKPRLVRRGDGGGASPTQQHAWSDQNVHDVLGPLPQLSRDWRDWTNTSSFTKPVENCCTGNSPSDRYIENKRKVVSDMRLATELEQIYDSSGSAASYPLTQSAHSHRRVFTGTNLRKSWFGSPCFGYRSNAHHHNVGMTTNCENHACQQPDPQSVPSNQGPRLFTESCVSNNIIKSLKTDSTISRRLANEPDRKTLAKPVFVISEASEDRQPLVQALHPAGLSGNLAPFEDVMLDKVNNASDVQELNHPINLK